MFTGQEITSQLVDLGVSHVVWIPDSTLGTWETSFSEASDVELVQVCREGEAWAIAAGLWLGGASPIVIMQCTGFFESGDSLRNAVHDYQIPLYGIVGYRSFLSSSTLPGDTCLKFTEPVVSAWDIDTYFADEIEKRDAWQSHYLQCRDSNTAGLFLMAEGKA